MEVPKRHSVRKSKQDASAFALGAHRKAGQSKAYYLICGMVLALVCSHRIKSGSIGAGRGGELLPHVLVRGKGI